MIIRFHVVDTKTRQIVGKAKNYKIAEKLAVDLSSKNKRGYLVVELIKPERQEVTLDGKEPQKSG